MQSPWEDVELGDVRYQIHIDTQKYSPQVNASYSHDYLRNTGVFDFPLILERRERDKIYCRFAAQDQGIVSHEAGHMVLYRLVNLGYTSHANAFHEAFADLTSHFYRFHNPETRNDFLRRLGNGQGCVGDTDFTCVRNSRHILTLSHVSQNEALCEEHELSRVFSNAVYDSMVTAYRRNTTAPGNILRWYRRTLVRAVLSLEEGCAPTLMDIAYKMLTVSYYDPQYRDDLGRNFMKNQLIVLLYRSPADVLEGELFPLVHIFIPGYCFLKKLLPKYPTYYPNPEFLGLCQ